MGNRDTKQEGKRIKSLETASDIVESIGECEYITLTELANQLGYSKSTIHYYLKTLENAQFVRKEEQGYRLGLRFLEFGGKTLMHFDFLSNIRKAVDQLADETGEIALIAVEEAGKTTCIYHSRPLEAQAEWHIGTQYPLHCTAFGKAIMAYLPEDRVLNIIEQQGLPDVTESTLTDQEQLLAELEAVRERGIAFGNEEHREGIGTAAVRILEEEENKVQGAVGIIGPKEQIDYPISTRIKAQRFQDKPTNKVKKAARIINNQVNQTKP